MSDVERFQPAGEMSLKDACLAIFRKMKPGDWIERTDLGRQVRGLTGTDANQQTIENATWEAREALAAATEVGVEFYKGGYKRLTPVGQYEATTRRLERTRRAVRRTVRWAGAALANPEITGAERHQLEQVRTVHIAQADLDERRANRHRPLPPGDAT